MSGFGGKRRAPVVCLWACAALLLLAGAQVWVADGQAQLILGPLDPGATFPSAAGVPASVPAIVGDARLEEAPELGEGLRLGGFSGLASLEPSGASFLTLTDRGPNGEVVVRGKKGVIFPLPGYAPSIVRLRVEGGRLQVEDTIPLRLAAGGINPLTGSPELTGLPSSHDGELAYDATGKQALPLDPSGVDTEGLAVDPRDGSFWVADENGPSILHLGSDGRVLARLVPRGSGLHAPDQNVRETLPGVLVRRKPNRGFEGIGIAPDGSRVFAIMQTPLSNPDKRTGEGSRHVRLVVLDTTDSNAPTLAGLYVYRTEAADSVGADEQDDVKIGDLVALSATRLLVAERDSAEGGRHKMVYAIDLSAATNLLGRDELGGKTLEQASEADLTRASVVVTRKTPIVDLAALGYRPDKLEGLAVVDAHTLAVINDNDFGIASIDDRGRVLTGGATSRLVLIRVPEPLQ